MADDGILGLLGRLNDPNALYQGALSDPATQQAMAGRGLLAMAGSFADSAMPTRMPTPLGAVLGHAAGALGTSQDAVMDARLKAAQAQLAGSTVGLQNMLGPAYLAQIEAAQNALKRPGGDIPSPPAPGLLGPSGAAPTGPISPDLVTWHAKNLGLDPLIAHTGADIESSYGANTGNKVSPSNTGVYQRAKADAPGGMNDTLDNQIKLGVGDLVTARDGLRASLGREPTNAEVYLAHQQGVSGATKLITNPDTPAGQLVPPVNISNNGGQQFVKAPASAFVAHWEQVYNGREAKFARGTLTPPGPTIASGGGPGTAVGGLLNVPDITGQMNAPIQGIPSGVAPGAPGPAPPAPAPGTPAAAAAAPPRSAGDILTALSQRTQAAGGPGPLPPGLPLMADASGKVPLPAGPPPGPAAPNLVPGGAGLLPPGLLGGGAGAPPGPPPQVAAGPPPGQPSGLLGPQQPGPPPGQPAPVPPIAQPQAPPPQVAAPPTGGPPVAPPLNLPLPPPMPGGAMGPPVQPTPQQMIAQGIVGISALIGRPAPDYMQKLAGQPLEMQMEAYKAYVQSQANQMTEKYKKEIEVASAQTLEYFKTQGALPADLTKMTVEQDLKLRNAMREQGFLQDPKTGKYDQIDPLWLDKKAREAAIEADARANNTLTTIDVTDPATGQQRKQQMTVAQARDYYRTQGGGGPGAPGGGAGPGTPGAGIPTAPGAASPATPPGLPGQPIYTPGREEELKGIGQTLGKEYQTVATDQTNAQKAKPYLLSIQQALQVHNDTGAGGQAKLDAWKAYMSGMQMVGLPVSPQLQDWIKNGEIIGKSGTQLGFELAKTLGSNEASTVVDQAVRNNPGLMTTVEGNKSLIGLMSAIIDHTDAKREFYDDWLDPNKGKHTSLVGAQTAFNKANPWEVTISQFAPYQAAKMDKAAYDKLPPGVKVIGPNGQSWIKPPPGGQ